MFPDRCLVYSGRLIFFPSAHVLLLHSFSVTPSSPLAHPVTSSLLRDPGPHCCSSLPCHPHSPRGSTPIWMLGAPLTGLLASSLTPLVSFVHPGAVWLFQTHFRPGRYSAWSPQWLPVSLRKKPSLSRGDWAPGSSLTASPHWLLCCSSNPPGTHSCSERSHFCLCRSPQGRASLLGFAYGRASACTLPALPFPSLHYGLSSFTRV